MIKIDIVLPGGRPSYRYLLNSAKITKESKVAYERDHGFVDPLIKGYKCTPEEAEFVKQQIYIIVDWLDEHPKQDPPQELFDGLHDAGYISDVDYARLESKSTFIPRCPVCGSPDLKNIGLFGLASSKSLAQRQCRNCGYKF